MLNIATTRARRILGSVAIASITFCLGAQASGQATAELQKLIKKSEAATNRTPAKNNRTRSKATPAATNSAKLKVPKFGVEATEKVAVRTFAAPTETIEFSEEVKSKARLTLQRYDRDKNGFLDEVELASGNWRPSPLTNDENGDGRLSLGELQKRYHKRYAERQKYREAFRQRRDRSDGGGGKDGRRKSSSSGETRSNDSSSSESTRTKSSRASVSRPSGAASRRKSSDHKTSSAFAKLDANEDRLVQMHEFSGTWTEKKLDEFTTKDDNGDGVISADEW